MLSAETLHQRGIEAVNAGRVRRADRLFRTAAARTDEPALLARITVSRAYVAIELGDPATAERLCREVAGAPGIAAHDRGVALSQLAMVQMRRGEMEPALASFEEGIASLDPASADLARALGNRGDLFLHQGRTRSAAEDFRRAADAFDVVGAEVDAAKARHNLGYALFLQGDLVSAMGAMEGAYGRLASVSPVLKAICEQDRAEVLLAAGLVREGIELLDRAARDYGARGLRQRQADAELVLARGLVFLDPRRARTVARRAEQRFRRLEMESWLARARVEVLAASGETEAGHDALSVSELADGLRDRGLPWPAASARLHGARLAARRGDLFAASELLAGVGGTTRAPLGVRLLEREVRAEVAAARGRRADALRHLRVGLADLHAWQSSFGSLDLQTGVAEHGVRLGLRGLALAVESGRAATLFEWSERARMLASRVQPVRAPEDEQIVADLAELRAMAAGASSDPAREAELRQRVRERAWQHRGSGEVADPVTLEELRAALDDATALAAYVVAGERMVALVVTGEQVSWVDLGDRGRLEPLLGGLLPDLDVAASDLPGPMAGFVRTALAERLSALAELLVDPVLGALGDRRVVLTPSGVLAGVPWTLLPGLSGRPVAVAQSATSWLARRTTPLRSASAGFVAGPRVARAEDEVTAAAKEWPSATALVGDAATAAAASELASSVDVLHVAAHGRHSAENPLFSGLQLADGPWFGYDIDRLRAVPDVVVLSACEVGRSTVRAGEELIGMATAWLHAGARCVVASPAAVNDQAAYDVLVAVHQQLAAGVDPAAALASAVPPVTAGSAPVPLVCFV